MVHPARPRSAANGTADSTWPSCPRLPSHWLSTGHPLRREPRVDEPERRDERRRVPGADQHPADDRRRPRLRRADHDLTRRHQQRAHGDDRLRTEAVDQHADRDLQHGVDEQLHDAEGGERGGGGVEPLRRCHPGDPEGAALRDGAEVGDDRAAEDQPGAEPGPGAGHASSSCVRRSARNFSSSAASSSALGTSPSTSVSGERTGLPAM